ncbi:hypothetical protein GGX14DRAFT_397318 [Mycena pura]|uniref:Uncharacterized protein n=1 Tax=Mycena pura TaxID=153505 RepID=A0AAD6Y7R9_9AGAR|nr:hypothetical protein GGX14DRAFT_397318 [Mycena pura]
MVGERCACRREGAGDSAWHKFVTGRVLAAHVESAEPQMGRPVRRWTSSQISIADLRERKRTRLTLELGYSAYGRSGGGSQMCTLAPSMSFSPRLKESRKEREVADRACMDGTEATCVRVPAATEGDENTPRQAGGDWYTERVPFQPRRVKKERLLDVSCHELGHNRGRRMGTRRGGGRSMIMMTANFKVRRAVLPAGGMTGSIDGGIFGSIPNSRMLSLQIRFTEIVCATDKAASRRLFLDIPAQSKFQFSMRGTNPS